MLKARSGLMDLLYISFGVPTTSRSPAFAVLSLLPPLALDSGENAPAYCALSYDGEAERDR